MAVLYVVVFHLSWGAPANLFQYIARLGWCGVDLFFVLSGFLITGILIDSKSSDRYFQNFVERRLRRIAPLYCFTIAAMFWVAIPLAKRLGSPVSWTAIPSSEQLWYWLPLANIRTAFAFFGAEPLGHFWSLAVEEQFYMVWPLIVLSCSTVALGRISAALMVLALVLRNLPFFLHAQSLVPDLFYRITPFHMDGLAAGALIAALLRSPESTRRLKRFAAPGLAISFTLTACLIIFTSQLQMAERFVVRFSYTAFATTFGFLVLFARLYSGSPHFLAIFLRLAPLRSFGKYSYAIYIVHPIFAAQLRDAARFWIPHGYWPIISIPVGLTISWCAGWCSWNFLEKRFNHSRKRRIDVASASPEPLDAVLSTDAAV